MDSTIQAMVASVRTPLGADCLHMLEQWLQRDFSWKDFLSRGAQHRVSAICFKTLTEHFAGLVPEEILAFLKVVYQLNKTRNLALLCETNHLNQEFHHLCLDYFKPDLSPWSV